MTEKEPFTVNKETDKTALVPRSHDKIAVMRIASPDQTYQDGKRYAYSADNQGVYEYRSVTDETLNDDHQDQLARELADLPLRGDNVIVKRNGQFVEGTIDSYSTVNSKGTTYKNGEFIDAAGNRMSVPISELTIDAQAEMDEAAHKKYLAAAKELIKNAGDLDAADKRELLDAFIANIDRAITRGEIKKSDGDSYSPDTINNQLKVATALIARLYDPAKKAGNIVTSNIPRSNGLREAFTTLLKDVSTAEPFEQALKAVYGQDKPLDSVESPVVQATVSEVDPFNALPDGVQVEVTDYREAVQAKANAQYVGDWAGAADAGREIYRVGKSLSPEAQEFLGFKY